MLAERAVQVRACLGVHDQPLAAGVDVLGGHHVGRQHHQVRLERQRRVPARRRDHVGPEREVGHELAVHHIPLDPVDTRRFQRGDLLAELGEVGGQHARGDFDRSRHRSEGSGCRRAAGDLQSTAMSSIVVRAEKMAAGGDAIARIARTVGSRSSVAPLPGELVEIEIVQSKKDFVRADVVDVLEPSVHRVEPPCPATLPAVAGAHGSTSPTTRSCEMKSAVVLEALTRTGKLIEPVVEIGSSVPPWAYRTTLRLAAGSRSAGPSRRATRTT